VSAGIRPMIQAAREANPEITRPEMLAILARQRVSPLPSDSTMKREFARVDARRKYAKAKQDRALKVEPLAFAGAELLSAAEVETGAIAALTELVVDLGNHALEISAGETPAKDVANRDANGHFTARYNHLRRRKDHEDIAPYLRSAEEKAEGRVPSWPRFVWERADTIDAKMRMLTFGCMVADTKGWDALRAPEIEALSAVTGFAYMPSTLSKFVSALAISGAGQPMLELVGDHWQEVASARWQEQGAMSALYIDNHAKEVWTSSYTRSGKVSHLNRVMPCITTTYAHTGAGTPLVLSVQSGGAPLAPRLVDLVEHAERVLGTDVRRAVVIDSEGSTFDLLETFARANRVLITPLKPSRMSELEVRYARGSYYRPYRENDELRVASATLFHRSSGRSLEIGALMLRRSHRKHETVLLTTGLALGMHGTDLADLYFARWPLQENYFKIGKTVGLNEHRGNCGRIVSNVAVVSELERLQRRSARNDTALEELTVETQQRVQDADRLIREQERAERALVVQRKRLDGQIEKGETSDKPLARTVLDHQRALIHAETAGKSAEKARLALDKQNDRMAKLERQNEEAAERMAKLEPQRTIRQLDVAQDSILTAVKLTALQLIIFVLREYLTAIAMTPDTFMSRVFSIPGRRETRPGQQLVVLYENPRDPEITEALRHACDLLNSRAIQRDGLALRFAMAPSPAKKRSG
jgi:hypothetical protein